MRGSRSSTPGTLAPLQNRTQGRHFSGPSAQGGREEPKGSAPGAELWGGSVLSLQAAQLWESEGVESLGIILQTLGLVTEAPPGCGSWGPRATLQGVGCVAEAQCRRKPRVLTLPGRGLTKLVSCSSLLAPPFLQAFSLPLSQWGVSAIEDPWL